MSGAQGTSTLTWPADGGFGGAADTAVIQLNNRDIGRINTLHIADPGPGEGILWTGTDAKIVVSPLDDDNVDGYLRLINDGPISLESDVHITADGVAVMTHDPDVDRITDGQGEIGSLTLAELPQLDAGAL